jgi:regulator of sigma E protease
VIHNLLVTTVAFIVLVGVMVVVHEFGHFIVAKLCGVRVEAFSVGFGPRLFGIKHGDTDYKVCLLPLGGFVKMTGENPGEDPVLNDPGAFMAHPRWQRMLIGLAGPVSNFILAFVLMLIYFGLVNEVPDIKVTKIEWVTPGSPADQAGIRTGDIIKRFDNLNDPDLATFTDHISGVQNQTVAMTVERAGKSVDTSVRIPGGGKSGELELSPAGMFLQFENGPIGIEQISPGSPAEQAGLRAHDAIAAVDGHAFHTVPTLLDYMQSGKGNAMTLTVLRNGAELPPVTIHPYQQDSQWRLGFVPAQPADIPVHAQPMKLAAAVSASKDFCSDNSLMIVKVLQRLLTRKVSVKQLSGPVGIAVAAGQAAQAKEWFPKFGLAASISLNLGILNLLPFPILDGGLILMLIVESIMRRDISIIVKERIYQAAFVVLVAFFAFIMFNDVSKLQFFSHFKP